MKARYRLYWGMKVLRGKNVNLRIMAKEDLPKLAEWMSAPEIYGKYDDLTQVSKAEAEKIDEPLRGQAFFHREKGWDPDRLHIELGHHAGHAKWAGVGLRSDTGRKMQRLLHRGCRPDVGFFVPFKGNSPCPSTCQCQEHSLPKGP